MVHVYQWYMCTNGTIVMVVSMKKSFPLPFLLSLSLSLSSPLFLSPSLSLSHPLYLSDLLHSTVISLQYYFSYITFYLITLS